MAPFDRGPQFAAVIGLFLGLAWLFFSMRMYVRAFLTKGWGVDDFLLIVAVALFTTYCTCAALGVKYGTGRHLTDIPPQDVPKALHFWFLCELFYALTTLFIRLSIAVFLIRICIKRVLKIIIYVSMTMITGFSIFYFFLVLFQCSPVDYFWNQYKGEQGECMNPAAVPDASIAHSAVSFTADWVLGLLPIALIWNLQMNRRTKISLGCILATGLLAGVATMIRIPYIKVLTITDDFLYATTDVAIWSTVEAGLGVVAASAYTLRPLFRSLLAVTSRVHHGSYATAKGANGGTYRNNPTSHPSRAGNSSASHAQDQPSHLDIPLRQDPSSHGPFGDSNEDVRGGEGASRGSESDGGIQVCRTFELAEERDGKGEGWKPWKRGEKQTGSSVSIV